VLSILLTANGQGVVSLELSVEDVSGHGGILVSSVDIHGDMLTDAELTVTCVDGQGVVSLELSVEDVSGHGEMLVSSVDIHGDMLTDAELTVTCVDGQRVVSLELSVEDVSRHGEVLVSSVDRHGVLPMLMTDDRQSVVPVSLLLEVISIPYVDGQGELTTMVVCSVNGHEVVAPSLTSAKLPATCVDRQGVVPKTDMSVPSVVGHGVLTEVPVSLVNRYGVVSILTVASADGQGVEPVSLPAEYVTVAYNDEHGVPVEMLVSSVTRHGVVSLLLTVTEVTAD